MKTVSKKLLSLMLVAILLVSAIPFQAFADPHVADDPNHMTGVWGHDSLTHWQECPKADCDLAGTRIAEAPHTFSKDTKVCVTCGEPCPHTNTTTVNAVAATCVAKGYSGDVICADCETVITAGTETAPTGIHTFVNHVCSVCGTQEKGNAAQLTLDANGGTVNGASAMVVDVVELMPINNLPDAFRQGYTFAGWYIGDTKINVGSTYSFTGNQTAVAKWTEKTEVLTVRRVLNGDLSTAKTLHTVNVPVGTPLLNYLNANVYSIVTAELALTPGYSWQYNFWKDYSGTQPLTSQADCMNQAQTVYVNFVSNTYTLYFNANGGSVTPTSKTVTFGSKVGTLPTPALSGKVFQGWKDANGNIYTADTVYKVAGDTSLTAVWQDEALVILYVYINGDFSSCNRMIVMDGFVKNNNISRADVVAQLQKYYTPASGYLKVAGLFDEYSWSSYRANTSKAGVENIQVSSAHPQKIYVMVNNATTGGTVIPTIGNTVIPTVTTTPQGAHWVDLGNGNGYWVYPAPGNGSNNGGTTSNNGNPKTGDTVMIEAAAAVMVLAAAALVTISALRKRKSN